MNTDLTRLSSLLRRRLEIIADHALRDRDPTEHLRQLQEVSETLTAEHTRLKSALPARLNHFLAQSSYSKALAWIEENELPAAHLSAS